MQTGLYIQEDITIPEHELIITTSRAGGPGGQHVNKTSSKITVRWNPSASQVLTQEQKERLLQNVANKLTTEGFLVVHNSSTRSQIQNKRLAYDELAKRIRRALHVPKKRMRTKVSKAASEKRLKEKREHSEIKRLRQEKF